MKCDEVQPFRDAYLDSELDAKTALEIQQHLTACPDCARAFATEARLDARMVAGLKRGQRTAALWNQIEQRVAAQTDPRPRPATRDEQPMPWWQELLWPHPRAWAGLAALWLVILGAHFAASESLPTDYARQAAPLSPQIREMLKEQVRLLAELVGPIEKPEAHQPKAPASQPRSQSRGTIHNT